MKIKTFSLSIFKNLYYNKNYQFVPKHEPCSPDSVSMLQDFVNKYSKVFVLTGAGVSTESGLPDYRSKDVGLYDRSPNRPVLYKDFISKTEVRKRYWARNFAGWKLFSSAQPNEVHRFLSLWEQKGGLHWLVTQNVDRLHHKAGSQRVTELHGTSYVVKCLSCPNLFSRNLFQIILRDLNPNFNVESTEIAPDADVHLDPELAKSFKIPDCEKCGGILKPDVVFFGESVPKEKVFELYDKVEKSDAILVLGSSLEVYSGYRFVHAASEFKKCIGIVNIGPTRADKLATFKITARCGGILPKIKL
ncbi:NAD-dependent protein lipoamidase sirtuin-4, mitochondrial-like [Argiope bruennichi]|uniref:NAD-dependent protein lipoamidase sirtuin-4, mitochondrial-like n=1 Tax=Argiope bruennichi TaxID=94029 RepID=UPI002494311D|nr:NAD-dependent protein lipoamidase sirtuin-4, mitochondrial-like [Argiope bruennichi]